MSKNISTTRLNKYFFALHGLLHPGICIRRIHTTKQTAKTILSTDKKYRPEVTSHKMLSKVMRYRIQTSYQSMISMIDPRPSPDQPIPIHFMDLDVAF